MRHFANKKIEETCTFFNKRRPESTHLEDISSFSPVQRYIFKETSKLIPLGTKNTVAVDLGCHWGRYSHFMANTYGHVFGVDFAKKALETALPGEKRNITYVQLDLNSEAMALSKYTPVAFFFAGALFEMIKSPKLLCQQLFQLGSPGSRALIIIPNRRSTNYLSLRAVLWTSRNILFKKKRYIYNNGITIKNLIIHLETAGFHVENKGVIIGLPVYIVDRLPHRLQTPLINLDALFKWFFGGSYHWVLAKKWGHESESNWPDPAI